jgi:hypothetical protein
MGTSSGRASDEDTEGSLPRTVSKCRSGVADVSSQAKADRLANVSHWIVTSWSTSPGWSGNRVDADDCSFDVLLEQSRFATGLLTGVYRTDTGCRIVRTAKKQQENSNDSFHTSVHSQHYHGHVPLERKRPNYPWMVRWRWGKRALTNRGAAFQYNYRTDWCSEQTDQPAKEYQTLNRHDLYRFWKHQGLGVWISFIYAKLAALLSVMFAGTEYPPTTG